MPGTDRVPSELAADRILLAHQVGAGLVGATGVAVGLAAIAVGAVARVTTAATGVIGAVAPHGEELAEVDAVHEPVVVQVFHTAGARTPGREEESEVGTIDDAVVVEVAGTGDRSTATTADGDVDLIDPDRPGATVGLDDLRDDADRGRSRGRGSGDLGEVPGVVVERAGAVHDGARRRRRAGR